MTHRMPLSYAMISFASPRAHSFILRGLTNAVTIENMKYEDFNIPKSERKILGDISDTLILAVSYAHKSENAVDGLLKANRTQIAQLKDVLEAIRRDPPTGTKYVRLWCDQVLSKRLQSTTTRPSWILYGLIPYAIYPVISLYSGDDTDSLSMWSACEQILSDGGNGCLFSTKYDHRERPPEFCKQLYAGNPELDVVKSVGDGLSMNENLCRLSGIIHSGLLDETVTYHISDAQQLIRLAYYMTRTAKNVSLFHAAECQPCLNSMCRDDSGFHAAVARAADVYDVEGESSGNSHNICKRLNRTRISYAYPKVRARRGYVDWHGVREFLPGAGLLAKSIAPDFFHLYKQNTSYVRVEENGSLSDTNGLVVLNIVAKAGFMLYIVLFISGYRLFSDSPRLDYSARLNFLNIEKFNETFLYGKLNGNVSTFFRHPVLDQVLQKLKFADEVDSIRWGIPDRSST